MHIPITFSFHVFHFDAKAVAELVERRFPKLNGKVEINHVGTTIGSHAVPEPWLCSSGEAKECCLTLRIKDVKGNESLPLF